MSDFSKCPYCNTQLQQATGQQVYPGRKDLFKKILWVCEPCDARVGCHPGTDKPLGFAANAKLRRLRNETHRVFDVIWKDGSKTRKEAYAWLREAFGEEVHIATSDAKRCREIINLCEGGMK